MSNSTTYEGIKGKIIANVEAKYGEDSEAFSSLRAALGDPGSSSPFCVVNFGSGSSVTKMLCGSAITPSALTSTDPETDGPDPTLENNTVLAHIIHGVSDYLEAAWAGPLNQLIDFVNAEHGEDIPNIPV